MKVLLPHVIEALAHDRLDLLTESERAEIEALRASDGEALEQVVAAARESSHAFTRALPRAMDDLDVDAMVRVALERAEHATERASARTLAIGATLGVIFAAASGSLAMTMSQGGLEPIRRAASLARAGVTVSLVTTRALDGVPGGAASVALVMLAAVSGLVWLARRFDGPLRAALPLVLLAAFVPTYAHAYDLEGVLPADAMIHVDADHAPRSVVLAQAAQGAGLGLVYTLPDDPPVTLHVRHVPLSEVLEAVLPPDAAVHATPRLLTIHASRASVMRPVPTLPDAHGELRDVVTFGGDARVPADQEVRDVITMGGDATIDGRTYGNVITMGGDADVSGVVVGDVLTMGGDIHVRDHGVVHGRLDSLGGQVRLDEATITEPVPSMALPAAAMTAPQQPYADGASDEGGELVWALLRYSLLFLAAILFLGLAPERLGRVQRAIVERPVRTLATGILGVIVGGVVMVVLCVSVIGIPVAMVLAIPMPIAATAALAAVVPVIGAMVPTRRLDGRPVMRLAAGAIALLVITRIPVLGWFALALALFAGLGALVLTRFGGRDAGPQGL